MPTPALSPIITLHIIVLPIDDNDFYFILDIFSIKNSVKKEPCLNSVNLYPLEVGLALLVVSSTLDSWS